MTAALNVVEPLLLKVVFDALPAEDGARTAFLGVGGFLVVALLREGLAGGANWLYWRTRLEVHYGLLESTVDRLHTLPVSFHKQTGVGATMTKLDRGIQGLVGALGELVFRTVPAVFYLVLSLVVMFRLEWRLALVVLAFAPVPALLGAVAAPEQARRERRLLESWARIFGRFNEVLSGIVTVKSFAMEDEEKRRFLGSVRQANGLVARGVAIDSTVGGAQNLVVALARIAAIALGGFLVLRGATSIGTVIAFLGYVSGLFGPVQGLTGIYQTLRRAQVSFDTVFAILDAQDHLGDRPGALEVARLRGKVELCGVRFCYRPQAPSKAPQILRPDAPPVHVSSDMKTSTWGRSGRPVLDGIDLVVEPGELVAIVGPSGAGKSTLMALLQRLYDPDEGCVRIDGYDVRDLKQRSLRRQIGVVLQDALLFDDSVRSNIAYGRPTASLEEVEAAARAANAHDFIARLPRAYDTKVGERGALFSAGERQRIAIARALLKDPSLLILDEASSALDAESEALVQEALERLIRGRTTFVIAHRLSTIVSADRILFLDGGRIVEEGSHRELLARGGRYAKLVQHQTRGLLPALADPLPAA